MKKILIVSAEFFPYVTANVNCMRKIIRGLQDEGCEIDVLTVCYEPVASVTAEIDGCRVFRTEVTEYDRINRALNADDAVLHKLPATVRSVLSRLLFVGVNRKKMRRMQKMFYAQMHEPYDAMLSVSYPMENHRVACAIARRTKIPWFTYNLDPYAYNASLRKAATWFRKARERRWIANAAGAVLTLGIMEENARHGYDPYRSKPTLQIPLPNLVIDDRTESAEKTAGDKIVLRYTGALYEDIRRPDELLRFLKKLDPERFVAEFYGQCSTFLRASYPELPACVRLCKSVSIAECHRLTETADVLINVGNLCPNQVPSKVFEYIATGKPILNFYSVDTDTSLAYLRQYPAALSVQNADEIGQDDLLSLYDGGRRIAVQTLREIYADCLCENVVRDFYSFMQTVTQDINKQK